MSAFKGIHTTHSYGVHHPSASGSGSKAGPTPTRLIPWPGAPPRVGSGWIRPAVCAWRAIQGPNLAQPAPSSVQPSRAHLHLWQAAVRCLAMGPSDGILSASGHPCVTSLHIEAKADGASELLWYEQNRIRCFLNCPPTRPSPLMLYTPGIFCDMPWRIQFYELETLVWL